MIKVFIFIMVVSVYPQTIHAQDPKEIVQRVSTHWLALHNNFEDPSDSWGKYTIDLTLEALLAFDEYTNNKLFTRLTEKVLMNRNITPKDTILHKAQPFCSINFALGLNTGNRDWFTGFIAESYKIFNDARKSPEGAVMINHENRYRILVDHLQEYASRMAKTGYLTDDTTLFSECVGQYIIYEDLLCNNNTGLWCQGRGWCADTLRLAQGAWSRGHGWLLRGIVTSMIYLPDNYKSQLLPILKRISYSLLKVQSTSGMFHILLHLPFNESVPDVSGTGMIAYYLSVSVDRGWLGENDFKPSILKATKALKNYVSDKGEVFNSSKGPGPLCVEEEYRNYQPDIDERHGFQAMVYGMMAEMNMLE